MSICFPTFVKTATLARFDGIPAFTGSIGPVCIYRMHGRYFMRTRSNLTGERVKTDPAFRKTMQFAGLLSQASKIASAVYAGISPAKKQHALYRKLTGEAMTWLRYQWTAAEIIDYLHKQYGQLGMIEVFAQVSLKRDYRRQTPLLQPGKPVVQPPPKPSEPFKTHFGRQEFQLRRRAVNKLIIDYEWAQPPDRLVSSHFSTKLATSTARSPYGYATNTVIDSANTNSTATATTSR